MKDTIWMERMSWPEIEKALADGFTTVIVTAGSIEQHGPHLPLRTDTLLSEVFAEEFARRIGRALVAPVIRPGCSDHHMAFPGTISLPPSQLSDLVVTYCRCLAHHGFQRLVLMATHGGNFGPVQDAANKLAPEMDARGIEIVALTNLEDFAAAFVAPLEEFGLSQKVTVNHADITETSFVLSVCPELVALDRAEQGFVGAFDSIALLQEGLKDGGLRRLSPNGILGDARGATAEIGRRVTESVVDYLFKTYREAIA
ncbi:MAG: creatininase family protein [Anaerolineales bacterium]|nr:creatininase family protein [Anaerolineales bacterium]